MVALNRFRGIAVAVALALAATGGMTACGGDDAGDGTVTLRYSWWGNADRATLMNQALALFQERNTDIKVTPSFQEYTDYWTKIATETAGGNVPDVLQMDFSYLREYADRGALLDLKPHEGEHLDVSKLLAAFDGAGEIDGKRYAVPIGGNTWSFMYNPAQFEQAGVPEPTPGWSWDDYRAAIRKITEATGEFGAGNYTSIIYNLESQLRQQGKLLFTEDGQLGFTREELAAFWEQGQQLRAAGHILPPEKVAEVEPQPVMSADLVASELGWDNFFIRYASETDTELKLGPVPTLDPSRPGQYLKPSMLLSAGAGTDHPEQAARLIDFLINEPEVGKIFGGNRGIPASTAQREAGEFEGPTLAVAEYEDAIADQLEKTPPAPPKGAGTLEAEFLRLGEELDYRRMPVAQAVDEFFAKADEVLGS